MNEQDFQKYRLLARVAKQIHIRQWFSNPNIVGMAFGRKIIHNQITDEPSVVVYVMKKVSKAFLPISLLLPRKIFIGGDCINVDVIETGPIYPLAFTAKERPAPSGISIGHPLITAGTLGCLVTDLTDGSLCILSNNHVLANQNAAALGDDIIQPGSYDGGVTADTIATLKRFQMINSTGNTIDAAIAEVSNKSDVVNQMKNNLMPVPSPDHPAVGLLFAGSCNRTIMNPIRDVLGSLNVDFLLGGPTAIVDADIGMNVEKVGRTTEYTTSTVLEIDATVTIPYDFGNASFDNQIVTAWMSEGGDSGSIVCRGGNGGEEDNCGCGASTTARSILQRDIKEDIALEKVFREKYFVKTLTGRYLLDTFFNNENYILSRVNKIKSHKEDVAYLQYLYDKYVQVVRNIVLNPESDLKITSEYFNEGKQVLGRLKQYLSSDEQRAAEQLFEIVQNFEGKSAAETLKMLDDKKLYNDVVKIVSSIEALKKKDC